MYLSWHVAAEGGAADDEAGALADSLADLIKGHGLEVEGVDAHPCAGRTASQGALQIRQLMQWLQ